MAASIGNLNIGVTLDGSQAQQGLANLVSTLDQFSAKVARAAAIGSFLGNLTFKAFETSVRGAVNMLETLSRKILQIRLDADRTKFNDMIANGADPTQVVKSKEFNESVLGGFSKLKLAWDGLLDSVTKVFGPAISGIFTGAAAMVKWLGENISKALDAETLNLQGMFENCYKIAIDIGAKIIEAGLELVRLVNSVKLLGNKTARNEAWDKILYDLGFITKKEWNDRLNENLKNGAKNGDIDGINQWADSDRILGNFKNSALAGLNNLKKNLPQFDPPKLAEAAGLKGNEAKPFDPMSIFGSSASRNSDEAYKARMMLQYKDLFPEGAEGNEQVKAIRDNTNVLGDKLDGIASALGGLVPAGVMDFGVA